jgi:hypothetical protein
MSDLIDRQAAIDAIRASTSKYTGFMEMEMYTADDAVEAIEAVPAASPWHRVEEPPKENGRYFVSWEGAVATDEYKNGVWLYASMFNQRVTYWMPIPEPPKGDA